MINNYSQLVAVHDTRSARLALSAMEFAVSSVDPRLLVRQAVKFGDKLTVKGINGEKITLGRIGDVHLVGAGKAVAGMADSLCSVLGQKVAHGAITVPRGQKTEHLKHLKSAIHVTEAAHPVPDEAGIQGSKRIIEVIALAKENDIVFVLISGGGSALLPLPAYGLDLADKQLMTDSLLKSGATIAEINIVRKHLSAIKGGRLARFAKTRLVSLILSDVIGDDLSSIASGPTVPDSSTFSDALAIVSKYGIASSNSRAVDHLRDGKLGKVCETPKPGDPLFKRMHNFVIGNNELACRAAVRYLQRNRIKATYLGSRFDGEARNFGVFVARVASDLCASASRFGVVLGGETTVDIGTRRPGKGGRNQEAALSCAMTIDNRLPVVAFMGTDGIDGNSDAAGALISRNTLETVRRKKIDLRKHLREHDSYHALKRVDSLIFTGLTGTNVNDISIVCYAD